MRRAHCASNEPKMPRRQTAEKGFPVGNARRQPVFPRPGRVVRVGAGLCGQKSPDFAGKRRITDAVWTNPGRLHTRPGHARGYERGAELRVVPGGHHRMKPPSRVNCSIRCHWAIAIKSSWSV